MIEKKYRLKRTKIVGTIGPSSLSKKDKKNDFSWIKCVSD